MSCRLDVMVIECTALPDKSIIGEQDVFVRVKVGDAGGGSTFDTHTETGRTNPKFGETFKFTISDPSSERVAFTVYASGAVSNDYLGEYSVGLDGLVRGQVKECRSVLQQCKSPDAEIRYQLLALDFGEEPPSQKEDPSIPEAVPVTLGAVVQEPQPAPMPAAAAPAAAAAPTFVQPQWSQDVDALKGQEQPNLIEKLSRDTDKALKDLGKKF